MIVKDGWGQSRMKPLKTGVLGGLRPGLPRFSRDSALACKGEFAYIRGMITYLIIGDRARLRERFYGESLSILARL